MHSSACLAQVQGGHSLTQAFEAVPSVLRPGVQAISLYAMRHWGLATAWRDVALRRPAADAWVNCHIALGLLLLDAALIENGVDISDSLQAPLGPDCPRYQVHTLVDQAVKAVIAAKRGKPAQGLVNAVLRRFQRERQTFLDAVKDNRVARFNHPAWWIDQLELTYPSQWQTILSASGVPPKIVLRVNRRQSDAATVVAQLREAGHACTALSAHAVMLEHSTVIERLPGYQQGWWSVQDLSAQRAVGLLRLTAGQRVLDACAAPGGKTAHLLESADLEVTALDQDPKRLSRVAENLARLKLNGAHVTLKAADVRDLSGWWDGRAFDVILADLPCTASGVVRRHPDIAWLRRASDLPKTAALQAEILDALWQTLAPGGQLLLVTCSVFAQEGSELARGLEQRHPDARALAAPGHLLPQASSPDHPSGQDGFFYGLFRRELIEKH